MYHGAPVQVLLMMYMYRVVLYQVVHNIKSFSCKKKNGFDCDNIA